MHRLGVLRVGFALLALGFSATSVSAGSPTSFSLPAVQIPSPGCEVLFATACAVKVGPVSTAFGTFSLDETGDVVPQNPVFGPPVDKNCLPLSGTGTLDFGYGDRLALKSSPSADTICLTQDLDPDGIPIPGAGPWPLVLTASVDGAASTGAYAGATGSSTVSGTWMLDPTLNTDPNCIDDFGQPIRSCGFSGEALIFSLNSVSIPDLQLVGGGGCQIDCGGGGGPGPGATPELDSIVLFGSALFSVGGYAALRRRASRR